MEEEHVKGLDRNKYNLSPRELETGGALFGDPTPETRSAIREIQKETENIVRGMIKARNLAMREGIRANTVVISNGYAKVKQFLLREYDGSTTTCRPMIAGMRAYFDDLPDEDMAFCVMESDRQDPMEELQEENRKLLEKMEALRRMLEE